MAATTAAVMGIVGGVASAAMSFSEAEKQKEAATVIAKMTLLKESAIEKRTSLTELMGMEQIELPLED